MKELGCGLCARLALVLSFIPVLVDANSPPELRSKARLVITGVAGPLENRTTILLGVDPDGDSFVYSLSSARSTHISRVNLTPGGVLTLGGICATCTGSAKINILMTDARGNSKKYTLTVSLRDRTGTLKINEDVDAEAPNATGLQKWHIYLIILGVIVSVGVVSSLVIYNCCTFHTDIYEVPMNRPNKIIDTPAKDSQSMNPFARPKKMSLVVKEAVRSGAADGVPYYGVRRSGVWIPNAPDDDDVGNKPTPPRLMSVSEVPYRRESKVSAPPPPSTHLRAEPPANRRKSVLDELPWNEITAPRP